MSKIVLGKRFDWNIISILVAVIFIFFLILIISIAISVLFYLLLFFALMIFLVYLKQYSTVAIIDKQIYVKPIFRAEKIYPLDFVQTVKRSSIVNFGNYVLVLKDGSKFPFQGSLWRGFLDMFKSDVLSDNYINEIIANHRKANP